MKFIINPLTDEKILLKSPEGKQILLEYVKCFQEGGGEKNYFSTKNTKNGQPQGNPMSSYLGTLQEKVKLQERKLRERGICKEQGLICTYNIQGTFIDSGIFDGTLNYILETPSIFCVQEIGGLSKFQSRSIIESKGGYKFRATTIRKAAKQLHLKIPNVGIWEYGKWKYVQYYWEGRNGGPKDTAILCNNEFYELKNILSIPFEGAGEQFRPIGGVLLYSQNLRRRIAVFTIHMPSLGGGVIPDIYNSIQQYLNNNKDIDIFLVGDFNLDADNAGYLSKLLKQTGSILYKSDAATQQSGRRLDYIIHRPAGVDADLPIVQEKLHTLLSYNVASSDHSSLGLCLEDIYFQLKKTDPKSISKK